MKETMLAVLKENKGRFVSGEDLSRMLRVSRTAVWKHIAGLRKEGYEIESSPRRGYRLIAVPDLLLPSEIQDGLEARILGRQIYHCLELESTNKTARELAAEGEPEGSVVLAERQTSGRGRLGRVWCSPEGGVWLSVILRPSLAPYKIQLITLMAAVAAVDATSCVTGIIPGIKWPNDLLVNGKKLAGILTEVSAEIDRVNHLILGIGVNANVSPGYFGEELRETATSLLAETGVPVDRACWVRAFLSSLEGEYLKAQVAGFSDMLSRWRHYSVTLGKDIDVKLAERTVHGKAVDINEEGALLVRTESGTETFLAGEVTLKK